MERAARNRCLNPSRTCPARLVLSVWNDVGLGVVIVGQDQPTSIAFFPSRHLSPRWPMNCRSGSNSSRSAALSAAMYIARRLFIL
jgi:hypothetical protein